MLKFVLKYSFFLWFTEATFEFFLGLAAVFALVPIAHTSILESCIMVSNLCNDRDRIHIFTIGFRPLGRVSPNQSEIWT